MSTTRLNIANFDYADLDNDPPSVSDQDSSIASISNDNGLAADNGKLSVLFPRSPRLKPGQCWQAATSQPVGDEGISSAASGQQMCVITPQGNVAILTVSSFPTYGSAQVSEALWTKHPQLPAGPPDSWHRVLTMIMHIPNFDYADLDNDPPSVSDQDSSIASITNDNGLAADNGKLSVLFPRSPRLKPGQCWQAATSQPVGDEGISSAASGQQMCVITPQGNVAILTVSSFPTYGSAQVSEVLWHH